MPRRKHQQERRQQRHRQLLRLGGGPGEPGKEGVGGPHSQSAAEGRGDQLGLRPKSGEVQRQKDIHQYGGGYPGVDHEADHAVLRDQARSQGVIAEIRHGEGSRVLGEIHHEIEGEEVLPIGELPNEHQEEKGAEGSDPPEVASCRRPCQERTLDQQTNQQKCEGGPAEYPLERQHHATQLGRSQPDEAIEQGRQRCDEPNHRTPLSSEERLREPPPTLRGRPHSPGWETAVPGPEPRPRRPVTLPVPRRRSGPPGCPEFGEDRWV